MKIIVGHSNMDLDCIGSIVLARYLFPDHMPVKSRFIHPVARKLQNLYEHHINFLNPKELQGEHIERIVIVDTRTRGRVKEYFEFIGNDDYEVEIFDHHPAEETGFPGALVHASPCGSNTSQLARELITRGISVTPEDATIALAGIYADTGNFTHENVMHIDFQAASFLLESEASLKLVKTFLNPLSAKYQITLFHEVLNRLTYSTVHGHQVISCYREIGEETEGLGAVVEKIFEVENQDVFFAVFHFPKRQKTLIIARNQKNSIDLNEILSDFGGGGHPKAASATVKHEDGTAVYEKLLNRLEDMLAPAVTAGEIMSRPVQVIKQNESLLNASIYLEKIGHTGLPVVDGKDMLTGLITLRDIMKGRRAGQMHAPVKAYMSTNLTTASPASTVREVEELLFSNNIGHLPVISGNRLVGIITRTDILNYFRTEKRKRLQAMEDLGLNSSLTSPSSRLSLPAQSSRSL